MPGTWQVLGKCQPALCPWAPGLHHRHTPKMRGTLGRVRRSAVYNHTRTKAGARTAPDLGHPQENHVLLPQQRSCLKLLVVPAFALLPAWHPPSWLRCAWWRSSHSLSLSPGPQPKQAQPLRRVGRPQALMPPGFVANAKCKAPSRCLAAGSFHQDKALSSREF